MVEQLGLAMMPLGGFLMRRAFTSGTTSGTSGSMRQAEELSTTIVPRSAAIGPHSRERAAPAEKSAMSTPANASGEGTFTIKSRPHQVMV